MTDTQHSEDDTSQQVETDGGVAAQEEAVDYLETEINILNPSTPFMQDHLRVVWAGFIAWLIITWGPVLATIAAPGAMTSTLPVIGFPAHYFLIAFCAPTGSLILAFVYAKKRDALDEKYGIDPTGKGVTQTSSEGAAATDGGVDE